MAKRPNNKNPEGNSSFVSPAELSVQNEDPFVPHDYFLRSVDETRLHGTTGCSLTLVDVFFIFSFLTEKTKHHLIFR